MTSNPPLTHRLRSQGLFLLRYGWPVLILLAILWFPFDWLNTVWPAFGVLFRMVFRNSHDHLVGRTMFFLIVGTLVIGYIPPLRRKLHWYLVGLVLTALIQEAIQAIFAGHLPTFTDVNAFTGDALGGISAFILWQIILLVRQLRQRRLISS